MTTKTLYRRTHLKPRYPSGIIGTIQRFASPIAKIAKSFFAPALQTSHDDFEMSDFLTTDTNSGPINQIFNKLRNFVPNVKLEDVFRLASNISPGLIATLGIAGIVPLVLGAYFIWKKRNSTGSSDKEENSLLTHSLSDIEKIAPELLKLEGWHDKIKSELTEAIKNTTEENIAEKIAEIKRNVMLAEENLGKGGMIVRHHKRKKKYRGGGMSTSIL